MSQAERAEELGIPEWIYVEHETGKRPVPKEIKPSRLRPTRLEECVLMRRREAMTQADLARELGCSRLWVIRMENGKAPADVLVEYWQG